MAEDGLFGTADTSLSAMWDKIQMHQVDFAIMQELGAYYTSDAWHRATNILDVGTGNGYYLERLRSFFPSRRYCGIDSSAELIHIACGRRQADGLYFKHQDLYDVEHGYDFAIARLLFQHLNDIEGALRALARSIKLGGGLLVIDAHDEVRFFHPEVPRFRAFFAAYTRQQDRQGCDRNAAARMEALAEKGDTGWELVTRSDIVMPSTLGGNLPLYQQAYALMIDIVDRVGLIRGEVDFDALRAEWKEWCHLDGAYTQAGLTMLELRRTV